MMPSRRMSLCCVSLATAVLCAATSSPAAQQSTTQSLGRRDRAPVGFVVSNTPMLRAGGLAALAADELDHRNGYLAAASLSDRSIAVIDGVKVRRYSNDGVLAWSYGRRGGGPGEFALLWRVCVSHGDTIVVQDNATRRVSVLSPSGRLVRLFVPPQAGVMVPEACFSDGTFLTLAAGKRPGSTLVLRIRLDGTLAGSLLEFTDRSRAAHATASISVAAAGLKFIVADSYTNVVTVRDTAGRYVRSVSSADAPDAAGIGSARPSVDAVGPEGIERLPRSARTTHWPFFGDARIASNGEIWLQRFRRTRDAEELWYVHRADGALLGSVKIPGASGSSRPLVVRIERSGVLVLLRDTDGAAHFAYFPMAESRDRR